LTNLDFFLLGTLARRNRIVHVRRASSDMPVYRMAQRALVGRLVTSGHNLVWSIEGGRSRTGKLRPPRYGLLRYVTDAISAAHADDALIVPVSIMYDQLPVHEVELMISESRGGSKQPENIKWLPPPQQNNPCDGNRGCLRRDAGPGPRADSRRSLQNRTTAGRLLS